MPKTFQVQNHIGEMWFCCLHVWHRRISVHHNLISYYITLPLTTTRDGSKAALPYFSGMNPTYQLFGFFRFTTCQCLIHWSYCLALCKLCCENITLHAADLPSCPKHYLQFFPNSQLIPTCAKPSVFIGKCNLCASRRIFSYSLIRNDSKLHKTLFSRVNAVCVSGPFFFYSLIHSLFQNAQNIVFSQENAAWVSGPILFYSLIYD